MQIQWTSLLLSIALLFPPLPLSASMRKFLKSRRNPATGVRSLLGIWQNWVDLIRAGVGVYLLVEFAVQSNPEMKGGGTKAWFFEAAILSAALLFQTVRVGQGFQLVAPIFYLCGFTLVLAGYVPGGFGIFAGWLFAIGGKNPAYQLPIMGVALGATGFLLEFSLRLVLACGLIFLPLVLAFMSRQQLAFVAREVTLATP